MQKTKRRKSLPARQTKLSKPEKPAPVSLPEQPKPKLQPKPSKPAVVRKHLSESAAKLVSESKAIPPQFWAVPLRQLINLRQLIHLFKSDYASLADRETLLPADWCDSVAVLSEAIASLELAFTGALLEADAHATLPEDSLCAMELKAENVPGS